MKQYQDLLKRILTEGDPQYNSRTGQLMIVSSGDQSVYDLREGFPLSTTKASAPIRWVAEEIFWMLRGETNAKSLYDKGINIWNKNAFQGFLTRNNLREKIPKNTDIWNDKFKEYENRMKNDPNFDPTEAELGPVYGYQWRNWINTKSEKTDQIKDLIESIPKDHGSRYHTFSAWNVGELDEMALKPCHIFGHFTITRDSDMDLHMFQRSCDVYLGVPFNIAQYALINHLVANETGFSPRKFKHSYSNVHIYAGVSPRSDFLANDSNLEGLQKRVKSASKPEDYLEIREWYLQNVSEESSGNKRKDHVPFILEQLSKTPRELPTIEIAKMPFFEIILESAKDVIKLNGYNPHKWDSKAEMAA